MPENPPNFRKFKKLPLLASLVFLAFALFAFLFLYKQINNNKEISESEQIEWQAEANRRNEIQSLDRFIKAIEGERVMLGTHFAESSNIVPFLDTIEELALLAKAKSEVVSVEILKDGSGLAVQVRAGGSFEAVYKFLLLLENSPYELEFVSVNMQKGNGQSEWDADFKIKLLSFIQ